MPTLEHTSLKTLLALLVHMPTITTETATKEAALDWVRYQVRDLPFHATDYVTTTGHPGLVLSTRRTKRPKVMLHAHLDVTPAPPEQFKLTQRHGHYYGRGVFDMKFAIACYLHLAAELGNRLPDYDFAISLTTDEEGRGGMGGARYLMASGWRPEVILNPDSTGNGQWAIQRAAKGAYGYRVQAEGQTMHGSRTWLAPNANLRLMNFILDLQASFPAEPCGDPEHAHATLNIGTFHGGAFINQVAAEAVAELDIRVMADHRGADMDGLLTEVASRHPGLSWERASTADAVQIEADNPYLIQLQRLMQDITGTEPELILSHGSSEAWIFGGKGIPVLMFGPPGGGHHADNEWLSSEGFEQSREIIAQFVETIARR